MTIDIEQIVQRVLEQLQPGSPSAPVSPAEVSVAASTTVRLSEPVITEEVLAEAVTGSATVVISESAIVTPSGHDFFRRANIAWQRESESSVENNSSTTSWKAIVLQSSPAVQSVVVRLKKMDSWSVELLGTNAEAVRVSRSVVCRAEAAGAVIFSDSPELIVCQANRNAKVRAAAVTDLEVLQRVKLQLSPNLLVIPPRSQSTFQLQRMLDIWTADGPPCEPKAWEEVS